MLEVRALRKRFGDRQALRGVSFRAEPGEVVALLGPNGAGKSTSMRIIAGFLAADSGAVRIAGHDLQRDSLAARRALGYLPELAPAYPELTVEEYLLFRAELKGVERRRRRAAVATQLERVRLGDRSRSLVGALSRGMRQRLGLADALLHEPSLLLLDEPTAGLDPGQVRELRAILASIGDARTVLISTHLLAEAEATCHRAVVLHEGRVRASASVAELRLSARGGAYEVELRDPQGVLDGWLRSQALTLQGVVTDGGWISGRLTPLGEGEPERWVADWVALGVGVRSIRRCEGSLEDAFAQLTAGEESR